MESPRQLEMLRPHLEGLPKLQLRPGCELRAYRPGDEVHWARIMNDCIGAGWTAARCLAELVNRPEFSPDGCFFALADGVPQGTATAWRRPAGDRRTGYVHMVGVAPEHRGRGLGRLVSLATLWWFRKRRFRAARLHTDDWRLPAIRVHLRLGFTPVHHDDLHALRWADVLARLEGGPGGGRAGEAPAGG